MPIPTQNQAEPPPLAGAANQETDGATLPPAPRPSPLSRRQFLRAGAGLALGVGLGAPALQLLAGCAPVQRFPARRWDDLAASLEGKLLRPGDPAFAARATPWALQYAGVLPGGIAQCTSAADVSTCLQWAQANQVPLVARSGGHSYGGYSTTTGLMIDVAPMNGVAVDEATGLATLGGGARNRNVYAACRPLGRTVTHGRCYDVGVAGLVLGGGIGFNMRAHGLTCDQLVATEIVLADGRILTCSETENADLFWACRGAGGGNFGIHTSFTFATFPVATFTVFKVTWTEQLAAVLAALQTMSLAAPNALGLKVSVIARKEAGATVLSIQLLGQLDGPIDQVNELLAPVFAVQQPAAADIHEAYYWDGQEFLSDAGHPEYSHERSRFAPGAIADDGIQTILANLTAWPGTGLVATWKYFLLGGVIDDLAPDEMAFVHRGYAMLTSIELEWLPTDSAEVVAENKRWLNAFHDEMEQYTSAFCYQNFIDPSQENYLHAYYGDNLPRLQDVKRAYDPGNVFHYPQSIPL